MHKNSISKGGITPFSYTSDSHFNVASSWQQRSGGGGSTMVQTRSNDNADMIISLEVVTKANSTQYQSYELEKAALLARPVGHPELTDEVPYTQPITRDQFHGNGSLSPGKNRATFVEGVCKILPTFSLPPPPVDTSPPQDTTSRTKHDLSEIALYLEQSRNTTRSESQLPTKKLSSKAQTQTRAPTNPFHSTTNGDIIAGAATSEKSRKRRKRSKSWLDFIPTTFKRKRSSSTSSNTEASQELSIASSCSRTVTDSQFVSGSSKAPKYAGGSDQQHRTKQSYPQFMSQPFNHTTKTEGSRYVAAQRPSHKRAESLSSIFRRPITTRLRLWRSKTESDLTLTNPSNLTFPVFTTSASSSNLSVPAPYTHGPGSRNAPCMTRVRGEVVVADPNVKPKGDALKKKVKQLKRKVTKSSFDKLEEEYINGNNTMMSAPSLEIAAGIAPHPSMLHKKQVKVGKKKEAQCSAKRCPYLDPLDGFSNGKGVKKQTWHSCPNKYGAPYGTAKDQKLILPRGFGPRGGRG
ncbi:hypothetical protein MKZ38_010172 [Zalerion maritima]|uniref:Uncharacterized protein n=1 Tax=Zalerion maritima TaxID=339359 RepID=A0AAD5RSS0_9PEZI|nr:hypothetical protein MKZ38_010172 [Zalerion maritima]